MLRKFLTTLFALALSVSPVYSGGTLSLMGIGPAANISPPSFTYNGQLSTATVSTSVSVTGLSIGAEAPDRLVVITVSCAHVLSQALSSASIGGTGVSAIALRAGAGASAPRSKTFLLQRAMPTGTTTTVALTGSSNFLGCVFGSYSLYNLNSTTAVGTCGGTLSCAVTTSNDGIGIAVGGGYQNSTATYSSGLTSANYTSVLSDDVRAVGASGIVTAASRTPTFAFGGTANSTGMSAASWR